MEAVKLGPEDAVRILIDFVIEGDGSAIADAAFILSATSHHKVQAKRLLEYLLNKEPNLKILDKYSALSAQLGTGPDALNWCDRLTDTNISGSAISLLRAWLQRVVNGFDASVPFYNTLSLNEDLPQAAKVGSAHVISSAKIHSLLGSENKTHEVEWTRKPSDTSGVTAYICCDNRYFERLFSGYADSLLLANITNLHTHVVNPSEAVLDTLQKLPENFSFSHETTKDIRHLPSYVQNIRYAVLADVSKMTSGPTLVTDLDFRFLNESKDLLSYLIDEVDIGYVSGAAAKQRYRHPWDQFYANFVFVGKNAKSFNEITSNLTIMNLDKSKNTSHLDQTILECVRNYFQNYRKEIRILPINSKFDVDKYYYQATGNGNNPLEKLERLDKIMLNKSL